MTEDFKRVKHNKKHITKTRTPRDLDPLITLYASQTVAAQLRVYAQSSLARAMLTEEYMITKSE